MYAFKIQTNLTNKITTPKVKSIRQEQNIFPQITGNKLGATMDYLIHRELEAIA